MAVFDCGVAAEVLLHVSSRSDEDGHVGVGGLVSLAVGGFSLENCLDLLDFSDKEELFNKGLIRFKEESFSGGKCGFMSEGDFFEEGDDFAEWPGFRGEPFKELLASDT